MIPTTFKHLAVLAAAALTIGCANTSDLKTKEEMAVAAGFKTITPSKPEQKSTFDKLPSNKFSRINQNGKTYYVLPDRDQGQAYVGGPEQYQALQEDTQARAAAQDNAQATSTRSLSGEDNTTYGDLSTWEGWRETEDWSQTDGQTN